MPRKPFLTRGASWILAGALCACSLFEEAGRSAGTSTVTGNTFGAEAVQSGFVDGKASDSAGIPMAGAIARVRSATVSRLADGTVGAGLVSIDTADAQGTFAVFLPALRGSYHLEIRSATGPARAYSRRFEAVPAPVPKRAAAQTDPVAPKPIPFTLSATGSVTCALALPSLQFGDSVYVGIAGAATFTPLRAPQGGGESLVLRFEAVPEGPQVILLVRPAQQGGLTAPDTLERIVVKPGTTVDAGPLRF